MLVSQLRVGEFPLTSHPPPKPCLPTASSIGCAFFRVPIKELLHRVLGSKFIESALLAKFHNFGCEQLVDRRNWEGAGRERAPARSLFVFLFCFFFLVLGRILRRNFGVTCRKMRRI